MFESKGRINQPGKFMDLHYEELRELSGDENTSVSAGRAYRAQCVLRAAWKTDDYLGDHHLNGENHKGLLY
jgi:hypothetical protein